MSTHATIAILALFVIGSVALVHVCLRHRDK